MSEQKYMTKKEAILFVANSLIETKGTATTLEITAVLQETFPEEEWGLPYVSNVMCVNAENYTIVGKGYRGIYVYAAKDSNKEQPKQYSIIVEDEAIYGSKSILSKICLALNLPYRFSESHNEFQDITKLPFTHLVNIVAKDMEGLNKDELKAYMNTSLFRYYATKV
jgi:hypothetical protein